MRLLIAALLLYGQVTVDAAMTTAPFMGATGADSAKSYKTDNLRSCKTGVHKVPSGKTDNSEQEYPIPCVVSNSHILDAKSVTVDPKMEGPCDGLSKCKFSGANQVCQADATPVTAGETVTDMALFGDNTLCKTPVKVVGYNDQGGSLRPRFVRDKDNMGGFSDDAFVKTIATHMDRDEDDHQDRAPFLFTTDFKKGWDGEEAECTACKEWKRLLFEGVQDKYYDFELYPTKECASIHICFDFQKNTKQCNRRKELHMDLKNGVLAAGTRKTAYTMDLSAGRTLRISRNKDKGGNIEITTGQNERIVVSAFDNKIIAFQMSHSKCLELPIKGLGPGKRVVDPKDPEETNKPEDPTYNPAPPATGETAAPVQAPTDAPTKSSEVWAEDTAIPTTAPPINSPRQGEPSVVAVAPNATGARRSGWLTWAYVYGSIAGTLLGFIICGIFFYFCRRSIYNNWYRGMYKRYGCDASGTTGGVTGAEFGETTTAGNTTIGATTAGATTGTTTTTSTMTSGNTTTGGGSATTASGEQTRSMITM